MAFATEAFVDRAYKPDGTLVPRDQPDAVIHDVKGAVQRAVMLVKGQTITADDGSELRITAQSLCVHGDNPDASSILRALNLRLKESGVTIAPFAA
jgi:5-oxoprolinase (ATP-hydrolysing) subunit A